MQAQIDAKNKKFGRRNKAQNLRRVKKHKVNKKQSKRSLVTQASVCVRKPCNKILYVFIRSRFSMPKRTHDENKIKKAPKKTRRSGVEDELRGGDTSDDTRVRTSIIRTALATVLRNNHDKKKSITRTLDRLARYGGTYRHLTGIFGAYVLLKPGRAGCNSKSRQNVL